MRSLYDTYFINLRGLNIEVLFEYYPPEKKRLYCKDGSGYPGSGPGININQIKHKGTDIIDFIENIGLMQEIQEIISQELSETISK